MKLDDELLRERFRLADAQMPAARPDVAALVRRGRARRARRVIGTGVAAVAIATTFLVSLTALLPTDGRRSGTIFAADGGAMRTSLTSMGVFVTYPSDWSLVLGRASEDLLDRSQEGILQLTNFEPPVLDPDAPSGGWLCPIGGEGLPPQGVLLVVRSAGEAKDDVPTWPVTPGSDERPGWCGLGSYATWRVQGAAYEAFLGTGKAPSSVDRQQLEAVFASLDVSDDIDLWDPGVIAGEPLPLVVASGTAFGTPWNLVVQAPQYGRAGCIGMGSAGGGGGGCYVAADGSLESAGPIFGNEDFLWSSQSSSEACGDHLLDGLVSDDVASVELRLLDGTSILMEIATMPESWDVPYRAWAGAIEDPPLGDPIGPLPDTRAAGTFVLRDAAGAVISEVRYATDEGPGC